MSRRTHVRVGFVVLCAVTVGPFSPSPFCISRVEPRGVSLDMTLALTRRPIAGDLRRQRILTNLIGSPSGRFQATLTGRTAQLRAIRPTEPPVSAWKPSSSNFHHSHGNNESSTSGAKSDDDRLTPPQSSTEVLTDSGLRKSTVHRQSLVRTTAQTAVLPGKESARGFNLRPSIAAPIQT